MIWIQQGKCVRPSRTNSIESQLKSQQTHLHRSRLSSPCTAHGSVDGNQFAVKEKLSQFSAWHTLSGKSNCGWCCALKCENDIKRLTQNSQLDLSSLEKYWIYLLLNSSTARINFVISKLWRASLFWESIQVVITRRIMLLTFTIQ